MVKISCWWTVNRLRRFVLFFGKLEKMFLRPSNGGQRRNYGPDAPHRVQRCEHCAGSNSQMNVGGRQTITTIIVSMAAERYEKVITPPEHHKGLLSGGATCERSLG